jgi:hypothetical protein
MNLTKFFTNIYKPNLSYFTYKFFLTNFFLKMIAKNLSYQTIVIKSYKFVKCVSYIYL